MVVARAPVRITVITDGCPLTLNGRGEHAPHGGQEPLHFGQCECVTAAQWMNAGLEQCLISVNVADTSNQCLVKQGCFHAHVTMDEPLPERERIQVRVEWFGSEPLRECCPVLWCEESYAAETSDIAVAEHKATTWVDERHRKWGRRAEYQSKVTVSGCRNIGSTEAELPCHPKVDE